MAQTDRRTGLVGYSGMKVPVRVASTAALTLSGEQTIDGVACVTDDRVLVKDQASSVDNGIYVVDTGDWNRAADCDGPYDLVQGSVVYVNEGTVGIGFWYCTSANDIDIGTDAITWAKASSVLATVSAFMQTMLDDTTAAAARTTLDGAQLTASMTEDTAPDKIADFIPSYDASAAAEKKLRLVTAIARAMPPGQGLLVNGKMTFSVAANALTIAVKGDDGNDPSATNPAYAFFRKASLTDSGFDIIPITAALSFTFSSGSTGGHASGIPQHLFGGLINNGGAAEVYASNLPPDYPGVFGKARLISTTAEGGVGGADSATGIYSTTARSNVPWICVAKALGTQATAGTWAAAMTQVDAAPFVIPSCAFRAGKTATQSVAINTFTRYDFNSEAYDYDSTFDAATNFWHQPNVAGVYRYYHLNYATMAAADSRLDVAVYKNGGSASGAIYYGYTPVASGFPSSQAYVEIAMNGTTDYVQGFVRQTDSNPLNVGDGNIYNTQFGGGRIPQ